MTLSTTLPRCSRMLELLESLKLRRLAALALLAVLPLAGANAAGSAADLKAKYAALGDRLSHNAFNQPLVIDSAEAADALKGDVYAVVAYPFATVAANLVTPAQWCDVMILHLNTKYCRPGNANGKNILSVNIGKKTEQELADTYHVDFDFQTVADNPDYLDVELHAAKGPLGTSDYSIVLEATPVDGKTFLHLTYSYRSGFASRVAMKSYLATIGGDKVGFSTVDQPEGQAGKPGLVGGVRGATERNTMRYYLAIEAYLGALSTAPADQLEKRLQSWYTLTERYPRQLHEVDRNAYLTMKRNEYRRQNAPR